MHLVIVEWIDAHTTENDTLTLDEVNEDLHFGFPITSCGHLVKSDADGITMCLDVMHGKEGKEYYRGAHFIPRGMVQSERKVPLKSKRKAG